MVLRSALGFLSLLLLISNSIVAGAVSPAQDLGERLRWLQSTSGTETEFEKKVYQVLQDRTETSEGKFSVRKGSVKVAVNPPNETLLVVNSEAVWLETPMGEDFPTSVQKMKRKNLKGNNEIWNILMGSGNLSSYFKVLRKAKGSDVEFELTPKGNKSSDLSSAKFIFKDSKLGELSYTDDIKNVVTYTFKKWKTVKLNNKDFTYKPPANAEVTEL